MNTYSNYLLTRTKKDLIQLAKLQGMSGYSSMKKDELARNLLDYLYTPSVIHNFFVYLGDDELNLIHFPESGHPALYRRMYEGGYCLKNTDGSYQIPQQLMEASAELLTGAFEKERQRKSFLLDCLNASGHLYGCFPASILMKMYNAYAPAPLKREDILQEIRIIPPYFQSFILENDLIIQEALYANALYKKIQQCQGTLPFYMPDKTQIRYLSRFGYFPEDQYTGQLSEILSGTGEITREKARELSGEIQTLFRQGGTMEDAVTFLKKYARSREHSKTGNQKTKTPESENQSSGSPKAVSQKSGTPEPKASPGYALADILDAGIADASGRKLLSALNNVFSHAALLLNRGYTAAEAMRLKQKKVKIYPNSPCPCGSGKKYKNCCGRR